MVNGLWWGFFGKIGKSSLLSWWYYHGVGKGFLIKIFIRKLLELGKFVIDLFLGYSLFGMWINSIWCYFIKIEPNCSSYSTNFISTFLLSKIICPQQFWGLNIFLKKLFLFQILSLVFMETKIWIYPNGKFLVKNLFIRQLFNLFQYEYNLSLVNYIFPTPNY